LRFFTPYTQLLDLSRKGPEWADWCVGGTTNIVLNCLDRHRGTPTWDQVFLVWEGEDPAEQRTLSYRAFDAEVARLAGGAARPGHRAGRRGRPVHAQPARDLHRLLRGAQARCGGDAAVQRLRPAAAGGPAERRPGQGRDLRRRHLAARRSRCR
jgi:hypothetical protein